MTNIIPQLNKQFQTRVTQGWLNATRSPNPSMQAGTGLSFYIRRNEMGKIKEYFIEKLGNEAMEVEMGKMQAPPLAKKVCLSTDDYFKKQWNEAELIVNKLKVSLQYPVDAPENLDRPESFESIESYKKWAKNLYCLSSDLADIAEHLEVLGNDNGQIESNYQDAQQDDGFQGYDKPRDYL